MLRARQAGGGASRAGGLRNWQFSEVLSGLAVGDQVVLSFALTAIQAGALAHGKADSPAEGPAATP